MAYTNGIGDLRQLGATETAATSNVDRATKPGSTATQVLPESGSPRMDDETTLSPAASLVTQALAGTDVRMEKVAALQQSIASGEYSVSSSAVAAKVLNALMN